MKRAFGSVPCKPLSVTQYVRMGTAVDGNLLQRLIAMASPSLSARPRCLRFLSGGLYMYAILLCMLNELVLPY